MAKKKGKMVSFLELTVPLISFTLLILFLNRRRSADRKRLPPSPPKLPIIGNLHQLGGYPHRSLQSLSRCHGELMLLRLGNVAVVVASSAAAAREIMKNQDLIFSNRPKLSVPDRLSYGSRDVAFSPYGDYWRQMRSISVLHLLSGKRVHSYRRVREEETSAMIERIVRLGSSSSPSAVVNLSGELMAMTNDIICRVALGRKHDGEFKEFLKDFVELMAASPVGDFVPWLAWIDRLSGLDAKVERVARLFDEFLERVIQERRDLQNLGRSVDGGDDSEMNFVEILLQFQRENVKSSPVEDEAIKALILDMFAAGTDTTYVVMDWTIAELIRNPRTMKILQNEVREAVGNKGKVEEEDLEKMPYLKAVIKESLRLHSPLPLLVPRESTKDTKLLGYEVVSGTRVVINAWAISRDPSIWENPEEFYPERFLDTSIDYKGLHFEFVPFGAGRRGCPGVAFAGAVIELAVANLVNRFNFGLANGRKGEDLDMSEAFAITVYRKLPLLVAVESRY